LDTGTAVVGSNLTGVGGVGSAAAHVAGGPGSSSFVRNTSNYDGANEPNMEFKADVPFTMVFWAKPAVGNSDLVTYTIASLRDSAGALPGWQFMQGTATTDRFSFVFDEGVAGEDEVFVANVFTNGVVSFVAATFDGTTLRLYKNGAFVNSATPAFAIGDQGTSIFRVSANQSGVNGFTGELSEMAFFSSQLSAGQIAALYSAGASTAVLMPQMIIVR
jgi:hypothetical protein